MTSTFQRNVTKVDYNELHQNSSTIQSENCTRLAWYRYVGKSGGVEVVLRTG